MIKKHDPVIIKPHTVQCHQQKRRLDIPRQSGYVSAIYKNGRATYYAIHTAPRQPIQILPAYLISAIPQEQQ